MSARERIVNGLWGLAGMLATLTVSTTWDNRQAIAVLNSKVIEVQDLSDKMDNIGSEVSSLSGRFAMLRAEVQDIQDTQREILKDIEGGEK